MRNRAAAWACSFAAGLAWVGLASVALPAGASLPDCSRLRSRYDRYAAAQTSAAAAGTSSISTPQPRMRSARVLGSSSPTQISARQTALTAAPSMDTPRAMIRRAQALRAAPGSDA